MANLISALPQQPSSNASPTAAQKVDPKEAMLLQTQFEQNMGSAISAASDEQEQSEKSAEMALLSGIMQKQALPELAQKAQAAEAAASSVAATQSKLQALKPQFQQLQQLQQNETQAQQSVNGVTAQAAKMSPQEIMNAAKISKDFTPPAAQTASSAQSAQGATAKVAEKMIPSEFQVNPLKKGQTVSDLTVAGAMQGVAVESLGVENLASEQTKKSGSHSSNLSTDSFLNLRELSQNKASQSVNPQMASTLSSSIDAQVKIPMAEGMTAASAIGLKGRKDQKVGQKLDDRLEQMASGIAQNSQHSPTMAKVMDAPVTQGSQMNHVLTHDTLHQIANHVANLNALKQDGEIKLRLKPDHLGELHMSVKTTGQNVSVQIKAQDEQSKKIIEESLSSLKDNLKLQNLTLGSIEVVTQPQNAQNSQMNSSQPDFASQMNFDQSASQQSQSQQRQSEQNDYSNNRSYQEQIKPVNVAELARARSAAQASTGRLDMIA